MNYNINFSKILKTKTFNVDNSAFNKVRVKLKFHEIDFDFVYDTQDKGGFRYCMGLDHDNELSIKVLLKEYNFTNKDINAIIDYISCYIKLNNKTNL
jgi:DUF4097 and DUF4098 domain-containing protein YvlB